MTISRSASFTMGVAVAAAFALGAAAAHGGGLAALGCAAAAIGLGVVVARRVERGIARPLGTAANVLEAMRRGDYSHRARTDVALGPIADLLIELNLLTDHLAGERTRASETAALLQQVVQRVDVALFAFHERGVLEWWNPAAERLLAGRLAAGATAASLGVEDWLTGPSERAVTVPGHAASAGWELRRGAFRREGARFHFVLLASLRRVRREEERAAWQRLLRVVGHEVNNTLTPIQSMAATCTAMLRDDGAAAIADVLRALEVIAQRAGSLGRFIGEYARLARLPTPVLAPIELGSHVRRVAAMETLCPVEVLAGRDLTVHADGALLEQALVNLVRNAAEAARARDGKVAIDWQAEGDEAVITIVDDGPGIENPDNLFVPLFSTKPGGSGIGLVLARNILEAHGGDVRLANRARVSGCIARVTIPLEASPIRDS
jgi:nitrogen fixation/metabolism regulation signal transduction histidine kinase